MSKHLKHHIKKINHSQKIVGIIIIIALALIGVRLLTGSRAESPYASVNADSGILGGDPSPSIISDSGASDGQKVEFGGIVSEMTMPTYLADYNHDSYYADDTTLNISNASTAKLLWTDTGSVGASAQPAVSNGVAYWGNWSGNEYATNISNGKNIWSTNIGQLTVSGCYPETVGVTSSATVANVGGTNMVFVAGGDANEYALNASTGAVIWKTSLGAEPAHFAWDSPVVYNGNLYIGISSYCDSPLIRGALFQMNATTGAIKNTAYFEPSNGVGSGLTSSPTLDVQNGYIYVATGNGDNSAGQLGQAIVQLSLSNLTILSHWTLPDSESIGDSDFLSTPTLFTADINGTETSMVGDSNKDGIFFALNRNNIAAGPVWQYQVACGGDDPQASSCGGANAPATFDGNNLYVAGGSTDSCGGSIQDLDPATGKQIWINCLPDFVLGAPIEVPGLIIDGSGADLYIINATTGATVDKIGTNSSQYLYGTPTISSGIIYVTNNAGNLIAIGN